MQWKELALHSVGRQEQIEDIIRHDSQKATAFVTVAIPRGQKHQSKVLLLSLLDTTNYFFWELCAQISGLFFNWSFVLF